MSGICVWYSTYCHQTFTEYVTVGTCAFYGLISYVLGSRVFLSQLGIFTVYNPFLQISYGTRYRIFKLSQITSCSSKNLYYENPFLLFAYKNLFTCTNFSEKFALFKKLPIQPQKIFVIRFAYNFELHVLCYVMH